MMRRRGPGEAWRRRADLNSLGLAVLLVLMAVLFQVGQSRWNDTRVNQCESIRADVTERTLIVESTGTPTVLTRYWTSELLPQLRERFARVDCQGRLPRIPKP